VFEKGTVKPETATHILDGYKVVDFSQVLAGPTVTRLMAEMGAEAHRRILL
jgi:crotonobetainyl-CoA:carnitine CoA-transferase CaiB-like acyl-CoA transferase